MKKQIVLSWGLLTASVVLGIISYILLPAPVVTQISLGGFDTTMPKLPAVLIPAALGAGGALATILGFGSEKSQGKSLLVSAVGIIIFILLLAVNL